MTDTSRGGWPPRFLEALRTGVSVKQAARMAGASETAPYGLRKRDADFRARWLEIRPADGRSRSGCSPERRNVTRIDRFIANLGETSNVAAACAAAGMTSGQVYRLRRSDPAFARRWFDALAEGYDNLEMELLGRLRAGETPDAGSGAGAGAGARVGAGKVRFDTATAFRCLAAHRENVAREKGRRTLAEEVATIESINRKIDRLRLNEAAADKAIAAARKANRERLEGADTSPGSQAGGHDDVE